MCCHADGVTLQSKEAALTQSLEMVPSPCCFPNLAGRVPLEVLAKQDLVVQQRVSAQEKLDEVGDIPSALLSLALPGMGI